MIRRITAAITLAALAIIGTATNAAAGMSWS